MCNDRTSRSIVEPDPIPGSRFVSLTKGKWAIVDEEDFEKTIGYAWQAHDGNGVTHARTRKVIDGVRRTIHLHHLVLGTMVSENIIVDHKDMNGLNCRKDNLRMVTKSQNQMNTAKHNGRAPYKGVAPMRNGRFKATIRANNKSEYLGYFDTAEDAGRAYDTAARRLHGEHGRYNFPLPGERSAT